MTVTCCTFSTFFSLICSPTGAISRKREPVAFYKRSVCLSLCGDSAYCAPCSHINLYIVISDFRRLLTPTAVSIEPSFAWIIAEIIGTRSFFWASGTMFGSSTPNASQGITAGRNVNSELFDKLFQHACCAGNQIFDKCILRIPRHFLLRFPCNCYLKCNIGLFIQL